MRLCIIFFLFFLNLNAQEQEQKLPHPAATFCNAMNVDVYELKLSSKEMTAVNNLAIQFIWANTKAISEKNAGDGFWISIETFLAGVRPKQAFTMIKLIRDIEENKKAGAPVKLTKEFLTVKFTIARLQKGNESQKRFAWMLAYAVNQAAREVNPAMSMDLNTLFAMVDQNVSGMNWRPVQQKKFIPSIITAKVEKGKPLISGHNLLETPDFLTKNKGALLSETSISQLYTSSEDNGNSKITIDRISCKIFPGRSHRSTSFDFDIGLSLNANVSFGEVLGVLSNRYPYLEPHKEVVFSVPESINDDSPSSGLGLSLLLLSLYEGVELDPNVISCADISVNGNILPAFDMTDKIKMASSKSNGIIIISVKNFQSLMDAFIIWGHKAIWNCQVVAARDISEAVNLARLDKPKAYTEAISEFKKIQDFLRRNPTNIMVNKKTLLPKLVSVLRKMPTHASAKALYSILNGKIPKELSLTTSLDLFTKTCKPVINELFEGKSASALTKSSCNARLQKVKKGLNKSMASLVKAMETYIKNTKNGSASDDDKAAFLREWSDLTKNRKFVDRLR